MSNRSNNQRFSLFEMQNLANNSNVDEPNSEQRRLSDGPVPLSSRRLTNSQYNRHPHPLGGSESSMLQRKNSSLSLILDSTSSMMRTASTTLKCLIGSARRASYCGQPDPSVQLAPNATCGSLYLRSNDANSNDSSLSNTSYDDQRRRVTIYDGRIPTAPTPSTIPFELMTPIEAITQTANDPVESFVQIVLETPDEQPTLPPNFKSTVGFDHSNRRRISVPRSCTVQREKPPNKKSIDQNSTTEKNKSQIIQAEQIHPQLPEVVQPMDFSFLEQVLGPDEKPPPVPPRTHSLRFLDQKIIFAENFSSNKVMTDEFDSPKTRRSTSNSSNLTNVDDQWKKAKFISTSQCLTID